MTPSLAPMTTTHGPTALATALEHLSGHHRVTITHGGNAAHVVERPGEDQRRVTRAELRAWLPAVPGHVAGCDECGRAAVEWKTKNGEINP